APYSRFEDHGPGGPLFGGGWNLLRRGGLARGEYLRGWLADQLDGRTFGSLARNGRTQLKVIAADVTRRRPVVFPDDLAGYRLPGNDMPIDPAAFQVAEAVRLSMLSPYLFEPGILVHHETALPSAIVGGLVPAPVSLFDALDRPLRPTFGVRAEGSRGSAAQGRRPLKLVSAAFDTAPPASDAWRSSLSSSRGSSRVGSTCSSSAGPARRRRSRIRRTRKPALRSSTTPTVLTSSSRCRGQAQRRPPGSATARF